jgi:hypothetical protein
MMPGPARPGPATPGPATPAPATPGAVDGEDGPRPLIERVGLGAIAVVVAILFGALSLASLAGGEVFLGVMAGIGALMTVWAAGSTLRR